MLKTVTIVTAEDWQGMYLDDLLIDESHSLDAYRVLANLVSQGLLPEVIVQTLVHDIERGSRLPRRRSELVVKELEVTYDRAG